MNESIGNNLEKPTLTLEQQKIVSEFTVSMAVLLDEFFSKGEEDRGRRVLTRTDQLIKKTSDPVIQGMLKNFGELLDTCSDTEGGIERILRKAINLSQIKTKQ